MKNFYTTFIRPHQRLLFTGLLVLFTVARVLLFLRIPLSGLAVTNLRMAYDCDIVLGGYLGSCLEEYREQLAEVMARWNRFDQDAAYLRFGKRGKEAAAMGAARQLMEDFWENF